MFPDVNAHERRLALHVRAVLVGSVNDLELAIGVDEPGPTAAEPTRGGVLELFLELREVSERGFDFVGQGTARLATGSRSHDDPEHAVVGVTAAVVDDSLANFFRNAVDVAKNLLDRLGSKIALTFDGRVEFGDVPVVVFAVMNFHRHGVDVRLKGGLVVRQVRECKCHGFLQSGVKFLAWGDRRI